MRFARTFVLAFLSSLLALPVVAQQASTSTTQSSPQALTLLHQSLAALTGGQSISDLTLSGTAHRIAGSDDESGTATFKAIAGASRLDLSLSGGGRSEIANLATAPAAGFWSGPDGVHHATPNHNLFTEPSWFPAFALSSLLSAPNTVITYIGPETRDGQSVMHIAASQRFPAVLGDTTLLMQHLTQTDIFLDPFTTLPVVFGFSTHPDNNALVDIPVEIRFSDYRNVSGSQIPFHVQKSLNNSLLLDLQFQSATLNSGLSPALFNVQ